MHRSQPLLDTHPEFTILDRQGSREFRVENWRLARDGSKRRLKFYGWTWLDGAFPIVLAVLWPSITLTRVRAVLAGLAVVAYAYFKCTQVLWESVIAIPSLGIQLETHRGLPSMPLSVSQRFIPLASLHDVIINEGLRGWDVRYYLAAVKETPGSETRLDVAYQNILPYFPVLLEVYHGVHDVMFLPAKNNPG